MRVTCTNCGGAHTPWDCKRPAKKSTAPKIEILGNDNVGSAQPTLSNAGEPMKDSGQAYNTPADDAPPVDTNPTVAENGVDSFPSQPYVSTTSAGTVGNADRQITQKRPRGRPKSITDMPAYKAAKQREYRAKWKGRE